MEVLTPVRRLVPALAVGLMVLIMPVYGQISSPCTPSVLNSFTPCMNLLTNSSAGGTSPTADCCNLLKSLAGNGMDCLCLIVAGSGPFQLPINQSAAISLPRACNMASMPVQCKASGAPIPAPGPAVFGPTMPPTTTPSPSPRASTFPESDSPASPPEPESTPDVPPASDNNPDVPPASPTVQTGAPTTNSGSRPALNPSAANPSHNFSPLLAVLGVVVLRNY